MPKFSKKAITTASWIPIIAYLEASKKPNDAGGGGSATSVRLPEGIRGSVHRGVRCWLGSAR
jgi:hypothetical protein